MKMRFVLLLAGLVVLLAGASVLAAADETLSWTTTLKVKLALLEKLGSDALRVDVDTVGDEVRLGGAVAKRETAELAETIARSVPGVARVDNDLKVAEPSGAATEAEAEVKDAVLESKVRLALIDRLGSDGFRIGTEAASGVVTLEFPAAMPAERRRDAQAATRKVSGVEKVVGIDKR
jgi:osmotically-inducible protein OsmY